MQRKGSGAGPPAGQDALKRLPFQVFHRDVVGPVLAPRIEGTHHVGMVETSRQPPLLDEHRDEGRLGRELGAKLLQDEKIDRTAALVTRRDVREIDDAHPTPGQLGEDAVFAARVKPGGAAHVQGR